MFKKNLLIVVGSIIVTVLALFAVYSSSNVASATSGTGPADVPSGLTMADRIRFQDQLWSEQNAESAPAGMSMQERIQFHDRLLDSSDNSSTEWTMADRIRFHDALWGEK